MALGATIYAFEVRLSDADRSVYETISLRLARHPSETPEFLCTRLIAYCLEYAEGLTFSKGGISDTDLPALLRQDLTGAWLAWIEVGAPEAARLHRATKTAPRVAVYVTRDPAPLITRWSSERIHRAETIEIVVLDPTFVGALTALLDRRMSFDLSVAGDELYLSLGDTTLSGPIRRLSIEAAPGNR